MAPRLKYPLQTVFKTEHKIKAKIKKKRSEFERAV